MTSTTAIAEKLLIVEDDLIDREAIVRILEATNRGRFEVVHAATLRDALEQLERESFEAVLLDLRLPDAEGLEGLAAVQQANEGVPVIVCSGATDNELAIRAVKNGAQDYLIKGRFDAALFQRAIDYAIERKRSEREIQRLAYFDTMTGVPNRILLQDRLLCAIESARRSRGHLAVLYLDMNRFKEINDTWGHDAGDEALRQFARRLTESVRATDTVARLGGDEFIVLIGELSRPFDAAVAARKVLANLRQPLQLEGYTCPASASIGIAIFPEDGETADELLRAADTAMYRAKRQGSARYEFFSPRLRAKSSREADRASEMKLDLDAGRFVLHYQPIVDAEHERVRTVEALLRWQRSEDQLMLPAEFLEQAENTGFIATLGEWVLREACRQCRSWSDMGFVELGVSVNLSAAQLHSERFPTTVSRALAGAGLAPQRLCLEFTEDTACVNETRSVATLQTLHEMNVRLSVDDFGTGPTSLTRLRNISIDSIKIDGSLVARVPGSAETSHLIQGIVQIAHGLGKQVIAEGIETREQRDFLRQAGCDGLQGFLLGRPAPASELQQLLLGSLESTCVAETV